MKMRVSWIAACACCLLALAGCSRHDVATRREAAATAPMQDKAPASAPAEASRATAAGQPEDARSASALELPQARMVIKTATVSVRVRDVDGAFARAVQLTEESGGYVQSSTQSAEGGDRADLTLRVPPERFLPLTGLRKSLTPSRWRSNWSGWARM